MRDAIRFFIEVRTPYRVCAGVGDGVAAIEKAKESRCDLILLDLNTPKRAARETALSLRGILPHAKIIGFTMVGEDFGGQTVTGFDVVLSQHEGLAKLAATMRNLLAASA